MSWPPASTPFRTSGSRLARAAYSAAVRPAGPEPRTTTSRMSGTFSIFPQGRTQPGSRRFRLALWEALLGLREEGAVAPRDDADHHGAGEQAVPKEDPDVGSPTPVLRLDHLKERHGTGERGPAPNARLG